jgi:antitoxin ParD1/3/4
MNVALTPELEKYLHDKVKSGMYLCASDVVCESLQLMHTYDALQNRQIQQLNRAIDVGLQQLNSGKKILAKNCYQRLKQKVSAMK